jgi:hypothetical protein
MTGRCNKVALPASFDPQIKVLQALGISLVAQAQNAPRAA